MTDYAAEQQDELESLECLYPTTFKKDKLNPETEFSLNILPHPDSEEPNHVGIVLYVKYTPSYPDEIPSFRVENIKGLKDKQIYDVMELAISLAKENIGGVSMFTISSEIQEWLVQNNIPCDTSLHDQMKAQNELKARLQRLTFGDEEKVDDHTAADAHGICMEFDKSYQRAKGTPVTRKTFAKWSEEFIKKYREDERIKFDKLFGVDVRRDQLTGVQIFEQKALEKSNLGDLVEHIESIDINQDFDNEPLDDEPKKKKKKKKKKDKEKTVTIGDGKKKKKNIKNDDKTVIISDESLFDMDMPDI